MPVPAGMKPETFYAMENKKKKGGGAPPPFLVKRGMKQVEKSKKDKKSDKGSKEGSKKDKAKDTPMAAAAARRLMKMGA